MQETLDSKKLEFSALVAEHCCMTNEKHIFYSKTNHEWGTRRRRAFDYCGGIPFQRRRHDEGNDQGIKSCFLSCSYSPYSFSIQFMRFRTPLVLTLDVCTNITEPFVAASYLCLSCFSYPQNPPKELGTDNFTFLLLLFIYLFFVLGPNHSCCPALSHHLFRGSELRCLEAF